MRDSFLSIYTSVKTKLSTLRGYFDSESKDALARIAQWEKDLEDYRLDEEFANDPKVARLHGYYRAKALEISKILSVTEQLSQDERKVLFARRKEIYGFLGMIGLNALRDIADIEKQVDFELEVFK